MPEPWGFGFDIHDPDKGFEAIRDANPALVISYTDPSDQERALIFNRSSLALLDKFRQSGVWIERGLDIDPGVRILRPKPAAAGAP